MTFAVTGHNPWRAGVGERLGAANAKLERDIRGLDGVRAHWRSFGFRKIGVRMDSCARSRRVDGTATMVALAEKQRRERFIDHEASRAERSGAETTDDSRGDERGGGRGRVDRGV